MGQKNEAGLSCALPNLSVIVTALSICVPGLSCCDVTNSMLEDWETYVYVYDRPVFLSSMVG